MRVVNTDAEAYWSHAAAAWVELEEHLEDVVAVPGRLAMEALGLEPGHRVLDVGCGAGATTVELARRVAPDGLVLGADIAPGMIERARERATTTGLPVGFERADAQVHDLGEGAFDAAYSRFGVMFFADPVAAFANIRRALRSGSRLGFACWQEPVRNEWMLVPAAAALAVLGAAPPPVGPDEPGPFAFADAGRVRSILQGAGFDAVQVESHEDAVTVDEADIDRVARANSRVGLVDRLLQEAPERRGDVVDAIAAALRERLDDGVVRAGRAFHVVTAVAS
jgi:SAM-dependent methyltransferase